MHYLSLDCLNLILKAANHAVELSNLTLCVTKVIPCLVCIGLHLLELKESD